METETENGWQLQEEIETDQQMKSHFDAQTGDDEAKSEFYDYSHSKKNLISQDDEKKIEIHQIYQNLNRALLIKYYQRIQQTTLMIFKNQNNIYYSLRRLSEYGKNQVLNGINFFNSIQFQPSCRDYTFK